MKCGICSDTTMLVSSRSDTRRPIYDRTDLVQHKKREHDDEYRKSRANAQLKREANKKTKRERLEKAHELAKAASKPIVESYVYRTDRPMRTTYQIDTAFGLEQSRYLREEDLATIKALKAQLAIIQYDLAEAYRRAYDNGTKIPREDWEKAREVFTSNL